MVSTQVFKFIGGFSSILTGILLFSGHILDYFSGLENGTVAGKSLVFIAHIIAVFAFVGIYEFQGKRNGILGVLGMVLSTVGTIIVSAIVYVEIVIASGIDVNSLFNSVVPNMIGIVGSLLFVVGMSIMGISIIIVKTLPLRGGLLLVGGNLVFAMGSVLGNFEPIFSVAGAAITCAGFLFLGICLIKNQVKNRILC